MDQLIEVLQDGPCHRDALRVFSDALLERGDPWGEAIRLALDLEQRFPGEPEWISGQRRLRRLQDAYGPSWRRRLVGESGSPDRWLRFFRAMPVRVEASGGAITLPTLIGSLHLSAAVDGWEGAAKLTELVLQPWGGVSLGLLAHCTRVTHLSVPFVGDATLAALRSAPFLPKLEALVLTTREATPLSAKHLEALLSLPLPSLHTLELRGLTLGAPGAQLLAGMTWRPRRVRLINAGLGAKGVAAVASAPWLASVRELALAQDTPGATGIEALVASPHLEDLVSLDLSSTPAKMLSPFFADVTWKSLRALTLDGCALKGKLAAPLAKAKLPQLTVLSLTHSLLGDEGLAELAKTKTLLGLRVLGLRHGGIKGPGLVALGKSTMLGSVEELELDHNKFQNAGAKGLAASKRLGALKELTLGHNWLGVQGLAGILSNPTLRLERLREGANNYAAQLEKSFVATKLPLVTLRLGPDTPTASLELLFDAPRTATLEWLDLWCPAFDDVMADRLLAGPLARAKTRLNVSVTWVRNLTPVARAKLEQALGERVSFH